MSNMAFGIFAKIKKINIMNISYISEQINEIVETVLPLQKSSGALQDLLFTHTHTYTPNSGFMDITHKALTRIPLQLYWHLMQNKTFKNND